MTPRDPLSSLRSPRIPFQKEVKLRFERFTGFIEEYCSNISPGGMFIKMDSPPPRGTVLGFEIRLSDDYRLIKGSGEVVWSRSQGDGPERPAGVGIRFQEIDPLGKSLIYRIMEEHVKGGGVPFDPDSEPEGLPPAPQPTDVLLPPAPEPAEAAPIPEDGGELLSSISESNELDAPPPPAPTTEPEPEPSPEPIQQVLTSSPPPVAREDTPPMDHTPPRQDAARSGPGASKRPGPGLLVAMAALLAVVIGGVYLLWPRFFALESASVPEVDTETQSLTPPAETKEASPPAEVPEEEPLIEVPVEMVEPEPDAGPASSAPDSAPFSRVVEITWEALEDRTVLTLATDGLVPEERFSTVYMGGSEPRELIRLQGVVEPFATNQLAVGTGHLQRIRVGYHPGQQLHVVADLVGPEIRIIRVEHLSASLRIHLGVP